MTNSGFSIIQWVFSRCWLLFTSWYIPGTNVTPAGLFFFCLAGGLCVKLIGYLLGSNLTDNPTSIESTSVTQKSVNGRNYTVRSHTVRTSKRR